jgi:tetratricopeptide (TPR) repeat protein
MGRRLLREPRGGVLARVLLAWVVALLFVVAAFGCAANPVERAQSLVRQHREDEAVATLRKELDKHPEDIAARRLLVRVLGFTGNIVAARAEVEVLAKQLPAGDPGAYLELGHALELAHRFDEALAAYDEAASAAPASPDGPREGGMRCARWGEAEQARPRLEEAIRRGARDAETWHTLGLVRLHLGDYEAAEEAYRAGTEADPKGAESWLGLATVAVARGDARGALIAYEQVVARRPRFAAAYLGKAWALTQLGRREEAAEALSVATGLGAPARNVERLRNMPVDLTPAVPTDATPAVDGGAE